MVEIFGKTYYIDIDGVTDKCRTGKNIKDEDGEDVTEVNIFKYEIIKMCESLSMVAIQMMKRYLLNIIS